MYKKTANREKVHFLLSGTPQSNESCIHTMTFAFWGFAFCLNRTLTVNRALVNRIHDVGF